MSNTRGARIQYGILFIFSLFYASRRRRLRLLSVVVPFLALCSCERFAGVGGVFSVGASCVRVTLDMYISMSYTELFRRYTPFFASLF